MSSHKIHRHPKTHPGPTWVLGSLRTAVVPFIHISFCMEQPSGSQIHGLQPSKGFNQALVPHITLSQKDKTNKERTPEFLVHFIGSAHKQLHGFTQRECLWATHSVASFIYCFFYLFLS